MSQLISEAINDDHKYIDYCHGRVVEAPSTEEKIKWRNQIVWTFARHAISEELTLYPAMEQHLGEEGKKMTETDLAQHQAIKEDLYKLQSMSPDEAEFSSLLTQLMDDFHEHVAHECQEDMPQLEQHMTTAQSQALARYFQRTKMMTPTRSHPSAPNKPYLENLVGLLTAPIDRLGDWVRSFPEDPNPPIKTGITQDGDPKDSWF